MSFKLKRRLSSLGACYSGLTQWFNLGRFLVSYTARDEALKRWNLVVTDECPEDDEDVYTLALHQFTVPNNNPYVPQGSTSTRLRWDIYNEDTGKWEELPAAWLVRQFFNPNIVFAEGTVMYFWAERV